MKTELIELNEKIVTKHNKGNEYDYSTPVVLEINVTQFSKLVYINNPGNCKIGTVMRLQDCMSSNEDMTVKRLKELFKDCSRKFGFKATFNNFNSVKVVAKYFKPMYIVKVPMVDTYDHQYHAMFWTGRKDGPSFALYKQRIEREKCEILLSAKDDSPRGVATEVALPALRDLTEAQIERIKSYKSKYFLVKYVQKLINGETV